MRRCFLLVLAVLGLLAPGTGTAFAQTPGCKLEPGPGPMRCADPNDPQSFFALKRALFAYAKLEIPRSSTTDPLCIVFTPQTMLDSSTAIPPQANPDAPTYKPYYGFMTYKVDLRARTMTIVDVTGPDGARRNLNSIIKLYEVPQPGWPCNLKTWAALLGNKIIDPSQVPDRRYR